MTTQVTNDGLPPEDDKLELLLRQWHEQNRETAVASRDRMLARLKAEVEQQALTNRSSEGRAAVIKFVLWRVMMHRYTRIAASLVVVVTVLALLFPPMTQQSVASGYVMLPDGGRLDAFNERGEHIGPCPLKHTDVQVHIAGHFSRTTVKQTYKNPYQHKVEAVYTFPLGHNGAVDRMTMTIGDRVIKGEVQERRRARETYEAARDQGYVASLLEQERPNIFTQSVANIEPGAEIIIEISYVEILDSIDGEYTFVFPMVVAPRYIPGSPLGLGDRGSPSRDSRLGEPWHQGGTFSTDTDQVEDASRVTPMPVKPELRAGHDISVQVRIETGGPGIAEIRSDQHDVVQYRERRGSNSQLTGVSIALKAETEIPNRDFILTWKQTGKAIEEALFTHRGEYGDYTGGFFTMILQPPHRVLDRDARPRELIFVMDNSGSMRGARLNDSGYSALDAAKEVINKAIDTMRPNDRFNVISFNNSLATLWDSPRPNTAENRQLAQRFVDQRQGGGGTEMANAIYAALGANQFAPRRHRSEFISPRQLADLLADGRQVVVQVALEDIHIRQSQAGDQYIIRIGGDLHVNLDLQAELPTVLQPRGVNVHLRGRWSTVHGRRVFVVTDAKLPDSDEESDLMRIVLFVTDGLVGNDEGIIQAVREHSRQSRVFTIGMSRSPNRYLLDKMAEAGRGAADYVLPGDDVDPIVQRFADRIATPVLTDITLDFHGVEVADVMPGLDRLPDLYDVSPLVIHGRYLQPGQGALTIRGRTGAGPFTRTLPLAFPEKQDEHDVIATLWARTKIDQLMVNDSQAEIIALGEQFQIMSKYTSFVAVEMQRKTIDGKSQLVRVPIEFPQGMAWDGVFGGDRGTPRDEVVSRQFVVGVEAERLVDMSTAPTSRPRVQAPSSSPPSPTSLQQVPDETQTRYEYAPSSAPGHLTPGRDRFIGDGPTLGGRDSGPPAGGGGGGGAGGGLFGDSGAAAARRGRADEAADDATQLNAQQRRDAVVSLIQDMIVPEAWDDHGGNLLSLRDVNGLLQVYPLNNTPEAVEHAARARQFIERYEPIFRGTARGAAQFRNVGFTESSNDLTVLRTLHERDVTLGFEDVPLQQAIETLLRETSIALDVNWASLEEWTTLSRRQTVSLPAEQRTIAHTLNLMLRSGDALGGAFVYVIDGRVRVAAGDAARRDTKTVVYDVADLITAKMRQGGSYSEAKDSLIDVLVENVDTFNWVMYGGDLGVIRELDGWLFIDNTVNSHRAVQDLLSQIRTAVGLAVSGPQVYEAAIDAYAQPVVVYDIRDLIGADQERNAWPGLSMEESVERLVQMIRENIDTAGWSMLGGETGRLAHFAGALVVSNTFANHERLASLLSQVRLGLRLNKGEQTLPQSFDGPGHVLVLYDVRDLLEAHHSPNTVTAVADLVMQQVDTEGWYDMGGSQGHWWDFAGLMAVSNSQENHVKVAESLYRMRFRRR